MADLKRIPSTRCLTARDSPAPRRNLPRDTIRGKCSRKSRRPPGPATSVKLAVLGRSFFYNGREIETFRSATKLGAWAFSTPNLDDSDYITYYSTVPGMSCDLKPETHTQP
jgi:hypothetical protein